MIVSRLALASRAACTYGRSRPWSASVAHEPGEAAPTGQPEHENQDQPSIVDHPAPEQHVDDDHGDRLGHVRDLHQRPADALAGRNLVAALWPISAMGLCLVAVQLRYACDVLQEYAPADFVKTARGKGAGSWQAGPHVFRHTAVPLVTVFFTDMLGMVVLGVFVVEFIVGIPGLGELTIDAVLAQTLPLVLSLAVLTVLAGVLANFAQDVAYVLSDPRVEFDE